MDFGDIATLSVAGIILTAFSAKVLRERRRRRMLVSLLHSETLGLCREAAELAEAICGRRADGGLIDQAFLLRYALTEPQTYPGLIPSLWRLPADLAWRAVEFHGHLCLARTRLADWRLGDRDRASTYLLLTALARSAGGGDGLLLASARCLGWRKDWEPQLPLANAFIDEMEREENDLLDNGYWSLPG
ncbi:hypothetical protein GCM10009116_10090 [Brevundimonas basaltis]|uniref:Uncharacterized protein n=1 Tax=Brevundimonas basaltis TaxID=472166 RepID=A0A7W8HY65_9CAUL|nr:hypothetical protein [Brevundimonas basaltis]MBB5292068.1 hypothetical protein [Brevundimonas basaltis]